MPLFLKKQEIHNNFSFIIIKSIFLFKTTKEGITLIYKLCHLMVPNR